MTHPDLLAELAELRVENRELRWRLNDETRIAAQYGSRLDAAKEVIREMYPVVAAASPDNPAAKSALERLERARGMGMIVIRAPDGGVMMMYDPWPPEAGFMEVCNASEPTRFGDAPPMVPAAGGTDHAE